MNTADYRQLRLPLACFVIALSIGSAIYSCTASFKEEARQALQKQQNLAGIARARYLASGDEKALIGRFLPAYRQLEKRGFIGEEPRVDWIDKLRDAGLQHQLFPIGYDIGVRQDNQAVGLNTGSFDLRRSTMKLHTPLLHEGDLLALLDGLPKDSLTPFIFRSCDIVPADNGSSHLEATCEIDWYTLARSKP